MPQDSIYYAIGRLSVLQKNRLDASKLERLLQAPTAQDARRALSEIGWSDEGNYEQMAAGHVESACRLARELTTEEKIVDCYLLRYDVNNLKMLLKARCLGIEAEGLSLCGVYPVDTLRHAAAEHQYSALPETLKKPLDELEKRLALNVDPLDIDVTLDKALYDTIFAWLPKGERTARQYFIAKVDILNLVMALRTLHMGKNEQFLKGLLLSGGTVSAETWLKTYKTPEELELEQENRIRRILIAIFTVLLLGAGVVLWFLGLSKEPGFITYYSICWKVGPVLFMVWLAWDQLIKLPRWAYTTLPLVLIAALINKKLLLVVVPVAAVLAFLNHPWWKKLR